MTWSPTRRSSNAAAFPWPPAQPYGPCPSPFSSRELRARCHRRQAAPSSHTAKGGAGVLPKLHPQPERRDRGDSVS
jgi:hypothetical protein